jgi:hypothetical protein
MKRAIIAILAIVIVWWEFQDDLAYWPPARGTALDSGYVWGEVVILGALGATVRVCRVLVLSVPQLNI